MIKLTDAEALACDQLLAGRQPADREASARLLRLGKLRRLPAHRPTPFEGMIDRACGFDRSSVPPLLAFAGDFEEQYAQWAGSHQDRLDRIWRNMKENT